MKILEVIEINSNFYKDVSDVYDSMKDSFCCESSEIMESYIMQLEANRELCLILLDKLESVEEYYSFLELVDDEVYEYSKTLPESKRGEYYSGLFFCLLYKNKVIADYLDN